MESVMGIIAWVVLGLAAGLIITCLIGIAGALLGGWVATKLFHIHSVQGFFNLSTWLTAIAGAAVLLLAYHVFTSQSSGRRSARGPRLRAPLTAVAEGCSGLRSAPRRMSPRRRVPVRGLDHPPGQGRPARSA